LISIAIHYDATFPELKVTTPIAGMLLISPWVSFSTDSESYEVNKLKDIFVMKQVSEWVNVFVVEDQRNEYSEPMLTASSWWKRAPVLKILVISGDDELFRDDIRTISCRMKKADLNVRAVNFTNQAHIECILDAETKDEPGQMSFEIWEWLIQVFNI
jgi:acetyl esterase/lipase